MNSTQNRERKNEKEQGVLCKTSGFSSTSRQGMASAAARVLAVRAGVSGPRLGADEVAGGTPSHGVRFPLDLVARDGRSA